MIKQKSGGIALTIAAIGVVYGDIGTSPLYALQAVFGLSGSKPTSADIFGIISLILWSITIVVSLKYVSLLMRADNKGEGGIMSLVALIRKSKLGKKSQLWYVLLGFLGLALFYGDSIITPAISVLSAVEGIRIVAPSLQNWIVPLTLIVLGILFALQSKGTGVIGRFFGPIMVLWFVSSGLAGLWHVLQNPEVLQALLPSTALSFALAHPLSAFIAMGAVILAITGAESLYADMGHFGRKPIQKAWFFVVFPALMLNYLGQGALVAANPETIANAYFLLFPEVLQLPMIFVATLATLIASQAVLAGAFSLTRQAVRLGFIPPMRILHTSKDEVGQVYIGALNWIIFAAVAGLVIAFGSSVNLAAAFGMAVSGTLLIDTILFLVVVRLVWKKSWVTVVAMGILFIPLDVIFLSSSLSKVIHGGWIPLLVALITFTLLTTWTKGKAIISRERRGLEADLSDFIKTLRRRKVVRAPGTAVYLSHHHGYTPLALHATLNQLHELNEKIVLVEVKTADVPHVPLSERVKIDPLGYPDDNISLVILEFGYNDVPNVPRALEGAQHKQAETSFDPYQATYFLSDNRLVITKNHRMSSLRKKLFILLERNATNASDYFHLPTNKTVDIASHIEL